MAPQLPPIEQHRVHLNGIDFAYLAAEPAEPDEAPLALCIHGFPDCAHGWRPLLTELAVAGFRAIAPFARGYAPTAVPEDATSPIGAWVADVRAFADRFGGPEPGVLVGHDWGALASYGAATTQPERWSRLVTAAVPPATTMAMRMERYDQLKAFWYQRLFMDPGAERIVCANDRSFIAHLWADWSPGFDATDTLVGVRDALVGEGNVAAALSTYRTVHDPGDLPVEVAELQNAVFSPHTQPTLYIHGTDDGCVPDLDPGELEGALPHGSSVEMIDGAGHFVHYEQPQRFNRAVIDFLTGDR